MLYNRMTLNKRYRAQIFSSFSWKPRSNILRWSVKCQLLLLSLSLCDPMDCRPPGPSVHGDGYLLQHFCCCSSVAQSCPNLCDSINCSMQDSLVHHQLQELAQTHVHRVIDAIQPSHLLLSPSSPAFSLSQHQGLF